MDAFLKPMRRRDETDRCRTRARSTAVFAKAGWKRRTPARAGLYAKAASNGEGWENRCHPPLPLFGLQGFVALFENFDLGWAKSTGRVQPSGFAPDRVHFADGRNAIHWCA